MGHAERNILKVLEGDCETAVGVPKIDGDTIIVEAELYSLDDLKDLWKTNKECWKI